MNQILKVGSACATGAFVGALVALEVGRMFWPVGLLVGGLVGYLSYEFRAVTEAFTTAGRRAQWMVKMFIGPTLEHRRWRRLATSSSFLLSLTLCSAIFGPVALALWCCDVFRQHPSPGEMYHITSGYVGGLLFFCLQISLIVPALMYVICSFVDDAITEDNLEYLRHIRETWNPLYFWGITVPRVTRTIVLPWLTVRVARAYLFTRYFVPSFLRLIHSEVRLLCAVDAAIGAGIGYFAGSALIGALAGAAIGVVNFELISKRWLKLVPQRDTLQV